MNLRGIVTEFSRVLAHPSDSSAALANDFGERDVWHKRVVHHHHARASPGEAFSMKQESALSRKRL
jgi:hypothetical protein